ncbi:helix-turn-helix domain-containing protein [Paenibacillus sp. YIM B09110]|uniref:helix-turn-helix domain-containing protein n=1 Tax=Paenibacillus sp. YIM B09110 TaxID=3126102 RepID=UPI00301BFA4B
MRLLIADDDDYTREGLVETIEWIKFGINEITQARDGAEALRLATSTRPHIVLTDIRMPKLNGIEFAEKLLETCPGSKLLFMSGFMDVEYLRSAIKLAAVDYIEKPLKLAEVEKAIEKTMLQLQDKQKQEDIKGEKIDLERERLAGLLREEQSDKATIARLCAETGYPTDRCYETIIVWNRGTDEKNELDALKQVKDYWTRHNIPAIGERLERDRCCFHLAYNKQDAKRVSYLMDAMINRYEAFTVSRGSVAKGLGNIPVSYLTSAIAMECSFYNASTRRFKYEETTNNNNESLVHLLPEYYKLLENQPGKLKDWIKQVCNRFDEAQYPSREQVLAIFGTCAGALLNGRTGISIRLATEQGIGNAVQHLRELKFLGEVEAFLLLLWGMYMEDVGQASKYSKLVQEVIHYVAAYYAKVDLDLTEIAGHMHLSTAHLGMLFKQETGTTIKQYISDYRIELAKKLVLKGPYKMNEIAEQCGYASASYFAKVFKLATGLTPLEYRKKFEG